MDVHVFTFHMIISIILLSGTCDASTTVDPVEASTAAGLDVTSTTAELNVTSTTAEPAVTSSDVIMTSLCAAPDDKWDGITFVLNDAEENKYWGPCGFPNPYRTPNQCGSNKTKAYVCDPDNVLNGTFYDLDVLVEKTNNYTPSITCVNEDKSEFSESVQIVVLMVAHMRTVDMQSATICLDGCGQIRPFLQPEQREATSEEVSTSAQSFPQAISTSTGIGSCGNDVIIFFVEEYGVFSGAIGDKAAQIYSKDFLDKVISEAQEMYSNNGSDVYDATVHIINKLDQQYGASVIVRGSGPAYMLLIILITIIIVFLLYFGCTYSSGRISDYWDDDWWDIIMKYILYTVFGIFIIQGLLWVLVIIQERVKVWWIVIPLIGGVICVVAAVIFEANSN